MPSALCLIKPRNGKAQLCGAAGERLRGSIGGVLVGSAEGQRRVQEGGGGTAGPLARAGGALLSEASFDDEKWQVYQTGLLELGSKVIRAKDGAQIQHVWGAAAPQTWFPVLGKRRACCHQYVKTA